MTDVPDRPTADAALEAAVATYLAAYESEGLLTEWVLLTAQHIDDGDGTSSTFVGHWVPDHQPAYRSLGLLDFQATRLRAHIAGNADTADR